MTVVVIFHSCSRRYTKFLEVRDTLERSIVLRLMQSKCWMTVKLNALIAILTGTPIMFGGIPNVQLGCHQKLQKWGRRNMATPCSTKNLKTTNRHHLDNREESVVHHDSPTAHKVSSHPMDTSAMDHILVCPRISMTLLLLTLPCELLRHGRPLKFCHTLQLTISLH
ncbi:hypothetical protein J6590_078801 [Homalodisca vitripennis]|nr:hypothetical protein J6590_078801 [Homalodisca vitripennis]